MVGEGKMREIGEKGDGEVEGLLTEAKEMKSYRLAFFCNFSLCIVCHFCVFFSPF